MSCKKIVVVQLYIRDVESRESRPFKELKNFKKVFLFAGENKEIELDISKLDLSYFSELKNKWVLEQGEFEVLIGSSSEDIRMRKKFSY